MQMEAGLILSFIGRICWLYVLFEWRGGTEKTRKTVAALCCAVGVLLFCRRGNGALNLYNGLIYHGLYLSAVLVLWSMAGYRDVRYWFTACSVHTLGYCTEAFAGVLSSPLSSLSGASPWVSLAFTGCFYAVGTWLFWRCGNVYRQALKVDQFHWEILAPLPCCFYLSVLSEAGDNQAFAAGTERPIQMTAFFMLLLMISLLVAQLIALMGHIYRADEEKKKMEEKLTFQKNYYSLAYSDSLTGLSNRRAFDEELSRIVKTGRPFFYASFDVNGLKKVNDERGHISGDDLLKRAAELLRENEDGVFTAYRVGGDEFAYLACLRDSEEAGGNAAPGSMEEDAGREEEIVRMLIQSQTLSAEKEGDYPFFAVGYGRLTHYENEGEILDFLNQVDRRMYQDKMRVKRQKSEKLTDDNAVNSNCL